MKSLQVSLILDYAVVLPYVISHSDKFLIVLVFFIRITPLEHQNK